MSPTNLQLLRLFESRILVFDVSYVEQAVAGTQILWNANSLKIDDDDDDGSLVLTCKIISSLLAPSSYG